MVDHLAGEERQRERRQELHEPDETQRQRAAGEIVDQPADRDRLHLVGGIRGGACDEQKPERAMKKRGGDGSLGGRVIVHRQRDLHLLQHSAASKAVWIGERFQQLEVIVGLADDQLGWLSHSLHGGEEFAGLALELRRLLSAVGENERRVQAVEMTLRTESFSTIASVKLT